MRYNNNNYNKLLLFLALVYLDCSVSPKGWYHGIAPPVSLDFPPFNFKVYAGKHCLTTLIKHC